MRSIRRYLSVGMACCIAAAAGARAGEPSPEWNPIRREPVSLGPEAGRLVVGFRITADNARTITVKARRAALVQAATSPADVAALVARTGLSIARSRQFTPDMHVLYLPR